MAEPPSPKRQRLSVEFVDPLSCLADLLEDDSGPRATANIKQQVAAYLLQPRLPLSKDPLAWWSANEHLYADVAAVARRFLSAPPTSVDSERLFSSAGNIYTDKRNGLLPEKADKLLFLKHNLPLVGLD